jgi:hypothetical protein
MKPGLTARGIPSWRRLRVILSHRSPELYPVGNETVQAEQQKPDRSENPSCGLVKHVMPIFKVNREEIFAFEVDGTYLFKQYFDRDDVFDALESHDNIDKYRFEIPESELEDIQQILDKYFFPLRIEDDLYSYWVVIEQGGDYSDVLRTSVLTRRRGSSAVFLIKDLVSVLQTVEHGARRLSKTNVNAIL